MKGFCLLVGGIILFAVTVWFLITYVLITDEQKIQRVIEKAQYSVENGSIYSFANLFADHYRHENLLDKSEVLGILNDLFQQTTERHIQVLSTSIQVHQDQAEASVRFLFTGQASHSHPIYQDLLTDASRANQEVNILFVREHRSWKILKTSF